MKLSLLIILIAALPGWSHFANRKSALTQKTAPNSARLSSPQATAASVIINGQTAGPTAFIKKINLTVSPADSLRSIEFMISPKPGSVTRPVSAVYSSAYLQSRGYLNTTTGAITLPVFGLYHNYSNTVMVTSAFVDGSSQQNTLSVATAQFTDPCLPGSPTVLQARTANTDLSYDFILIRTVACNDRSPVIIDTDGAIRWVGTAGVDSLSSMIFESGIYLSSFPPASSSQRGITRMEFDGTSTFVHDYGNIGVTYTGHHTYDPGKEGMLIEVDTTTDIESVLLEVDACGNVLKRWDFAQIISAAMVAGGDNPNLFVNTAIDWFHMNAATYRKSDNSLIVSSRENFVICIDYDTSAIKWILGDSTKQWYTQFPSLRQYALTLGPNTLPPIGQHAVSITYDDHLLLFDNGRNSINHTPAGANRAEAVPRKYRIDTQANVATEVWNYPNNPTVLSPFCSSVYEDSPLNYLVDYAIIGPSGSQTARILGLNAAGTKIFDYQYSNTGCSTAWNSVPIHLENMRFTGPDAADTPTGWQITSFTRRGNVSVIGFRGLANETYRVEYKDSLTDPTWQTVVDRAFQCTGAAVVEHPTVANHPDRVYRVRLLP